MPSTMLEHKNANLELYGKYNDKQTPRCYNKANEYIMYDKILI